MRVCYCGPKTSLTAAEKMLLRNEVALVRAASPMSLVVHPDDAKAMTATIVNIDQLKRAGFMFGILSEFNRVIGRRCHRLESCGRPLRTGRAG